MLMLFRLGFFFWFVSLMVIYYALEVRTYIELQSDEPSGIFVPMDYE